MAASISTTFTRNSGPVPEETPKVVNEGTTGQQDHVEVPYTDSVKETGHPYIVEHYQLGDTWETFNEEVSTIDSFIQSKIHSGDIANTKKAVEKELKVIEKLNNIRDEDRPIVRLGVLSSYIKFLNDTKNIKRYANL